MSQDNPAAPSEASPSPLPPSYRWLLPGGGPFHAQPWAQTRWHSSIDPVLLQTGGHNASSLAIASVTSHSGNQSAAVANVSSGVTARTAESSGNQAASNSGGTVPPSNTEPPPPADSDTDAESLHGPHRRQRTRVSARDPIYGVVSGARRGNKPFAIVRNKSLRPPLTEQVRASARFLRCVSDIMERCERVSHETGCWLHFSAQHMFGQGGYLHYTSPRFLKEAKQDAEQIVNHFNNTFATLLAARNQESKDMHRRLLVAEEHRDAANAALAAAQEATRNAERQAQNAQQERDLRAEEIEVSRLELEALRAQLKLAQRKNGAQQ